MNIFVDSDVLLDVGLEREPFCQASSQLLDYLESHPQQGFIAWHSVANVFYLFSKVATREEAKSFILDLCQFLQVVPTGTAGVKEFALILESGIYSAPESGIYSAPGYGINSGLQRHLDHYSLFIPCVQHLFKCVHWSGGFSRRGLAQNDTLGKSRRR